MRLKAYDPDTTAQSYVSQPAYPDIVLWRDLMKVKAAAVLPPSEKVLIIPKM